MLSIDELFIFVGRVRVSCLRRRVYCWAAR